MSIYKYMVGLVFSSVVCGLIAADEAAWLTPLTEVDLVSDEASPTGITEVSPSAVPKEGSCIAPSLKECDFFEYLRMRKGRKTPKRYLEKKKKEFVAKEKARKALWLEYFKETYGLTDGHEINAFMRNGWLTSEMVRDTLGDHSPKIHPILFKEQVLHTFPIERGGRYCAYDALNTVVYALDKVGCQYREKYEATFARTCPEYLNDLEAGHILGTYVVWKKLCKKSKRVVVPVGVLDDIAYVVVFQRGEGKMLASTIFKHTCLQKQFNESEYWVL